MQNRFEIVTTRMGAVSIRDNVVNEIMHNPVGPWIEANSLYIEQSKLKTRLLEKSSKPFVVFDVGLGSGTNAVAVWSAWKELAHAGLNPRGLKIISFEKDLELLKFTLNHAEHFSFLNDYVLPLQKILEFQSYSDESIQWDLRCGDFTETVCRETEKAHLILYDPYSPQMNKEMWTIRHFKNLFNCLDENEGGLLLTYSRATPVRAALLGSGFYVGYGESTGLKDETTQAANKIKHLDKVFGVEWLNRWKRSGTPYPFDCTEAEEEQFKLIILNHPLFLGLS